MAWTPQAPVAIETFVGEWTDAARSGRVVPYRVYLPREATEPAPLVVFSHGLGGSREGGAYLGRYWAERGYVSVHIQHAGSDNTLTRGLPRAERRAVLSQGAGEAGAAIARYRDLPFALDQLVEMNRSDPRLRGRIDPERIAMAGHSFGAHSVLAAAGQKLPTPGGEELSFVDRRIKAAIALSPAPPRNPALLPRVYGDVRIPILHMTGTLDASPVNDLRPEERQLPFRHIAAPGGVLVVFDGARHDTFGGRRTVDQSPKDPRFHELIQLATTAFLDAHLRGDKAAGQWLQRGGFAQAMGANGTIEVKDAKFVRREGVR